MSKQVTIAPSKVATQGPTTHPTSTNYVTIHLLDPEDAAITAAMGAMVSSRKGARSGIEARGQFDALMESVLPLRDVTSRCVDGDATWVSWKHREIEGGSTGARCHRRIPRREARRGKERGEPELISATHPTLRK